MTEQEQSEVDRLWMPPLVVWPASALVLMIGNVVGHYRGLYAQTDVALQLQIVMIVAMAAGMLAAGLFGGQNDD